MRYLKDGYHLERDFFDVAGIKKSIENVFLHYCEVNNHQITLQNFNQTLIDLFEEDVLGFIGCAQLCQMIPELNSLSVDKAMISKLKQLGLRNPVINTRPLLSFSSSRTAKNEDYWKIPAHQDWPSTQGSLNGVTCWMPLVNVDQDLGPLEICVGSHLNGPMPHTEVGPHTSTRVPTLLNDEFDFLSIPMNSNDALFFSNFTIHRSGLNSTKDRIRISVHFRYDDADEPVFIRRKYPKHKIETRAAGNLMQEFPMAEFLQMFQPIT